MIAQDWIDMTDAELLDTWRSRVNNGEGQPAGQKVDSPDGNQTARDAIAVEGWRVEREVGEGVVLARDKDVVYLVGEMYGPWAVQLTYPDVTE